MREGFINADDITEGMRGELEVFDEHTDEYYRLLGHVISSILDDGVLGAGPASRALQLLDQAPGHGSVDTVSWLKTSPAHLVPGLSLNS